MANNLDTFFSDKFEHVSQIKIDKILCILEGGDELSFIRRVYGVFNNFISCEEFINNKIKLSYGQTLIEWQGNTPELQNKNKKNCNFRGGNNQENAPLPILRSLNNEDLELYKAIIVMFDKDRDINNFVENESKTILASLSKQILFLSTPCFEKETITFFDNENIQSYIQTNYKIIGNSKCQWYKTNYAKLLKYNPIKNKQKLSTVIPALEKSHFESTLIDENMKQLIYYIKLNF